MAIITTDSRYYAEIAAAIREKNGLTLLYKPSEMAAAILAISGGSTSKLPEGYIELAYIQCSGTQYIDTGFVPNQDTRAVLDVQITADGSNFFGARTNTTTNAFTVSSVTSSSVDYWRHGYNNASPVTAVPSDRKRHIFDANKNVLYMDGNVISTQGEGTFTCPVTATIGVINSTAASTGYYKGYAKFYSCKIYDNGTLVRDYVPCINPSGEVGMYDNATKAFFGNDGTGVFTAGYVLPAGYTPVEYIQSSGTQYVDTGFKPSWNSRVVVDVSDVASTSGMIFGCRNAASATATQQFNIYRNSNGMRSDYFGTNATLSISDTTPRTVIDKNKNVVTMYGATVTNTAVSSGTVGYNLFLFANNNVGTPGTYASCKLYSCQIYDNGTLVRDYVPCVDSSGAYGLYDMINAQFYSNAGSGSFTGA